MRKSMTCILIVVLLVLCIANTGIAQRGPAPNSGDGDSDGPGWEEPYGSGRGPAPNSGDGDPDGPGWDEVEIS